MNPKKGIPLIHIVVALFASLIILVQNTAGKDEQADDHKKAFASVDRVVATKYGLSMEEWNKLKKKFDIDKDNHLSKDEVTSVMDYLEEKAGRGKVSNDWDTTTTMLYGACGLLGAYILFIWYKNNNGRYGQGGQRRGAGQTLGRGPRPDTQSRPPPRPPTGGVVMDDSMIPPPNAKRRNITAKSKSSLDTKVGGKNISTDPEFEPPVDLETLHKKGEKLIDNERFDEPPIGASVTREKDSSISRESPESSSSSASACIPDLESLTQLIQGVTEQTRVGANVPSTGNSLEKKPGGGEKSDKSKSPSPTPAKEETTNEAVCRILSKVFNTNVEFTESKSKKTSWSVATFQLKKTDIPVSNKDVMLKTKMLFERRLAREVYGSSKIKFAVMCFENTCEVVREESNKPTKNNTVLSMIKHIKENCISGIIENLINEQSSLDDDDLFSGIDVNAQAIIKSGLVNFLDRLSGWAEDGAFVSQDLLSAILDQANKTDKGAEAIAHMVRVGGDSLLQVIDQENDRSRAGQQSTRVQRLDDLERDHGQTLRGLEILLSHPVMVDIVSRTLCLELTESKNALGIYFEDQSILGSLLKISSIPTSFAEIRNPQHPNNQAWVTLKNFPKISRDDLSRLEGSVMSAIKRIQNIVFKLLKSLVKKHREVTMSWIAAVISTNEMRTSANFGNPTQEADTVKASCNDGFMINMCSVMIDLCLPFCQPGNQDKLLKVSPLYCASKGCRLNYHFETCLAGGQIISDEESNTPEEASASEGAEFNFMTEIFHLTLRELNIGFFTSLKRFTKEITVLNQHLGTTDDSDNKKDTLRMMQTLLSLRWDCCLLDPELLKKTSQFYVTVAQWITAQLANQENLDEKALKKHQKKVLSQVPEFIIKDMARWFWFLSEHGLRVHKDATAGLDLVPFVECCVNLLQRPDLVPGPIPAFRITQALNSFVRSASKDHSVRGAGWGGMISSPLASIVHTSPAVTTHLGPALLHTYVSVAVVEGLDVDKEDFDKYAARADIGDLIENLWGRIDFRASILKLCGEDIVQHFLGAILDTLLYQLHDSWARLANVRKMQHAKQDEASWNRLSFQERTDKDRFLTNEEGVAKGFMKMARKTLGLLDCVTSSEEIAQSFTRMPLAQRAASAFLGFLDKLCGSKAIELKVNDMDKYNFSPMKLLAQILDIMLRVVKAEGSKDSGFVVCMSRDDDYSEPSMAKALSVVQSKGIGGENMEQELADLVASIRVLRSERPARDAAESGGQAWMADVDALVCDESLLTAQYIKEMEEERFDAADLLESHSFQGNADSQPVDPRSLKSKSLMKEIKQWSSSLPIHPHASVYLRQDEERMDVVRALVTGPVDTPYSLGCFAFDIYFPANYPNIPPLVKLITTGNGTVRFNPNLYADGKVCLSLLGTWHGGDASQKWQADKSSLYQVLVSIQSMILITDPMYNEPGYDGMRGTEEGETRSRQYNSTIRLWTVRHAMLGQLVNPPVGFEDVVKKHFRLERGAVLKQCCVWLRECTDKDEHKKLLRVVEELREALDKLADD